MKQSYEKPTFARAEMLQAVTAQVCISPFLPECFVQPPA
jgi:hypothetical protein